MNKEFEELVKERLRLDPTQAVSKFYNSIRWYLNEPVICLDNQKK